jgi:hypothetical protein
MEHSARLTHTPVRPTFYLITGEPTGVGGADAKAESVARERHRPMNLIQVMLA